MIRSRQALMILLCVSLAGMWLGCEIRRDSRLTRGARREAVKEEPIVRVRIAQAVDRVLIDASDRVRVGPYDHPKAMRSFATPVVIHRLSDGFVLESADMQPVKWAVSVMMIESENSGVVRVGGAKYPHQIVLYPIEGMGDLKPRFDVINHTPIEKYLPGVLEKELFPHWHPNTFKAQAIAARSYAIDRSARRRDHPFDVESTVASQAYGGVSENPVAIDAVRHTRGIVILYKDHILPAYYSSCSGGVGQDAWEAFPDGPGIGPLRGRRQGAMGASSPNYRWGPIDRKAHELGERLGHWGQVHGDQIAGVHGVEHIEISGRNSAGRPIRFRIIDTSGKVFDLAAESFRFAVNYDAPGLPSLPKEAKLKSSFVQIENEVGMFRFYGQGFGHGVGMCQWGAQGMAIRGQSAESILAFYYPGTQLVRAY